MTEKDKMLAGALYDANDAALRAERLRAKRLCHAFNRLAPDEADQAARLLRELLGHVGSRFSILPSFWCDYGYNITLGEGFFSNHNLVVLDCAPVVFGRGVLVGPNCGFYTASHPLDIERRRAGLETARPITVGDDVWFGGGVQVLPGVSIGAGSVIAAGSVVTRDIPAGVLAAGSPCRVVRRIQPQ